MTHFFASFFGGALGGLFCVYVLFLYATWQDD